MYGTVAQLGQDVAAGRQGILLEPNDSSSLMQVTAKQHQSDERHCVIVNTKISPGCLNRRLSAHRQAKGECIVAAVYSLRYPIILRSNTFYRSCKCCPQL